MPGSTEQSLKRSDEMSYVMAAIVKSTTLIFEKPVGVMLVVYDMGQNPLPEIRYYTNMTIDLASPVLTTVTNFISEKITPVSGQC